jgi:transketolase
MTDTMQAPVNPSRYALTGWDEVDLRAVDTARLLAADAVQKVGNGHPGTAMSLAPVTRAHAHRSIP